MEKTPDTHHRYRIEVRVPRVTRPTETTWRSLAPPDTIEHTLEVGDHLRESLLAAGLDTDQVDAWFANYVRMIEYRIERHRTKELPVVVTRDGSVRPRREA